jgi:hypothetical protein
MLCAAMAVVYIYAQVAKAKGGLYHLKKEMYREVDTNWPSFTYVLSLSLSPLFLMKHTTP